jgi:hypothetical protein
MPDNEAPRATVADLHRVEGQAELVGGRIDVAAVFGAPGRGA